MRRPLVLVLILALAACDEPVDVVYVGGPPMEGGAPSPPPPPPPPPTTTPAPPPPGPSGPAVDVLSARSGIPRGIALDATNVYWSNHDSGSILKCAKAGCAKTPTVIAIAPGTAPWAVAVDASNVYWSSESGTIAQCPLAGCGSSPTVLASGRGISRDVVVDATHVYWTEPTGVYRCAIGGCGGTPSAVAGAFEGTGLAADATNVYFGAFDGSSYGLYSCVKAGCGALATQLATSQGPIASLAIDGTKVYWGSQFDGDIMSCALGGCPAGSTRVSSPNGPLLAITVDAKNVYWSTGVEGRSVGVYECAVGAACGDAPTGIVSGDYLSPIVNRSTVQPTTNVAVDATGIYLGNVDGSIVRIMPK